MNEPIITYHSKTAAPKRAWVAYVDLGHDYLGIRFEGETEEVAFSKADTFWKADQAKREATIASREAARIKAAETRARKAAA